MISLTAIATIMCLSQMKSTSNPMKFLFSLLIVGSLVYTSMQQETGQALMSLLMYIIFISGILMMFVILISTMPNEKSHKMKLPIAAITMMIMNYGLFKWMNQILEGTSPLKNFLTGSMNTYFIVVLMCIYFFSFIKILGAEKISLRSIVPCYDI